MGKWIKKVTTAPLEAIAKVIDSLSTTTNDRTNAPSIRAVRDEISDIWATIYPIGSIYMSTDNTNPSVLFGGAWTQIKDAFLLACGDTYENGERGGTATNYLDSSQMPRHSHEYYRATAVGEHTLTVDEIPPHSHIYGAARLNITGDKLASGNDTNLYTDLSTTGEVGGGAAHSHPLEVQEAYTTDVGTGAAVDNMPPYLAVNVWVRTA